MNTQSQALVKQLLENSNQEGRKQEMAIKLNLAKQ